jgi:uncharacterized protein (DUF433 family)
MGGDAVFKGTRIPIRMVAAMLRDGASEKEILDGYPKLSSRMLELANLWAIAHPGRGRPRNSASEGYRLNARERIPIGTVARSRSRLGAREDE